MHYYDSIFDSAYVYSIPRALRSGFLKNLSLTLKLVVFLLGVVSNVVLKKCSPASSTVLRALFGTKFEMDVDKNTPKKIQL